MINRIIIFLTIVLLSAGCSKDSGGDNGFSGAESDVQIELHLPVTYSTRTADSESIIGTLDLLVFDGDIFMYRRHAYLQSATTYRSTLQIGNNQTIYFLANCRDQIDACSLLIEGNSWENQIKPALLDTDPAALTGKQDGLPMWGMKKADILEVALNNLGTVSMLRSVASVEVTVLEDKDVFEMTRCYIYFAPNMGYLASSEQDITDFGLKQLVPKSPAAMTTTLTLTSDAVSDQELKNALYLFDNDATAASGAKRYSRLVVGGKYNKDTKETYYALDFLDNEDKISQVTRNHKYTFVITKVNGVGVDDPDDASEMAGVNIEADVIDWERYEDSDIYVDGSFYISINSKNCLVGPEAQAFSQLPMASNIPVEDIELEFRDATNGTQTTNNDGSISNTLYTVSLVENTEGFPTAVKVTALTPYTYSDSDPQLEYVQIKARNISFFITVARTDNNPNEWNDGGEEEHEIGKD